MKKVIEDWLSRQIITPQARSPIQHRQGILLIWTSMIFAVVPVTFGLIYALALRIPLLAGACFIFGALIGLSPFVFRRTQSVFAGALNVLVWGGCLVMFLSLYTGGTQSPAFHWFLVIPVLGAMLVGRTMSLWGGVISISLAITLDLLEHTTIAPANIFTAEQAELICPLSYMAIIGAFTMVSIVYRSSIDVAESLLKKKEEEMRNLVRVLVHDCVNPLMVIRRASEILREQVGTPGFEAARAHKTLDRIIASNSKIQGLLERVRILQAVEAGKTRLQLGPVDAVAAIRTAMGDQAEAASKKGVELVLEAPEGAGLQVVADEQSLSQQVLGNLISNAIKFSPPQGIVRLVVSPAPQADRVAIRVQDHGIGIPKEILPRIFDPYAATSRPGTQGEKGTGFGLPLVKSYVDVFHGDIQVESHDIEESPDQHGSTFILNLKKAA